MFFWVQSFLVPRNPSLSSYSYSLDSTTSQQFSMKDFISGMLHSHMSLSLTCSSFLAVQMALDLSRYWTLLDTWENMGARCCVLLLVIANLADCNTTLSYSNQTTTTSQDVTMMTLIHMISDLSHQLNMHSTYAMSSSLVQELNLKLGVAEQRGRGEGKGREQVDSMAGSYCHRLAYLNWYVAS